VDSSILLKSPKRVAMAPTKFDKATAIVTRNSDRIQVAIQTTPERALAQHLTDYKT